MTINYFHMRNRIVLAAQKKNLEGTIILPASKSISNRVLIIQSLCDKKFKIENISNADDTVTLKKLLNSNDTILNAGDGGTTFRFLLAYLTLREKPVTLTASERMLQRPIQPMIDALNKLGAKIEFVENVNSSAIPINRDNDSSLHGGEIEIDASISSQFISALLLIAPYFKNGLTVKLKGKEVSASYTEMTISLMKYFGADVKRGGNVITVSNQLYQPKDFNVESDWSAASYWYSMAALAESSNIFLPNLYQNSLQGDCVIAEIMKTFGVSTSFEKEGIRIIKQQNFSLPVFFEYDFLNCPDLFQTVCVVCAALNIPSRLKGLQTLQYKETDRLAAMETELKKLNAVVKNYLEPLTGFGTLSGVCVFEIIKGIDLNLGATISTYNDHRMAMAFAPLALKMKNVTIENSDVVSKSYPDFWNDVSSSFRRKLVK